MKLTNKQKKIRKLEKELNSLKNKLDGSNLIWFNSLSKERQFDFLIEWKREKWNKRGIQKTREIKKYNHYTRKLKVFKIYPVSLKHFIKDCRSTIKYKPSVSKYRDTFIESLLG